MLLITKCQRIFGIFVIFIFSCKFYIISFINEVEKLQIKKLIYIIKMIKFDKKKFFWTQVICIGLLLLNLFASLLMIYMLGQMVNAIFSNFERNRTLFYIIVFVLLTGVSCLTAYWQSDLTQKFGKEISLCLKNYLYHKILNKNIHFWSNYTVGELETILVTDVNKLEYIFTNFYTKIVVNLLSIVGISILIIAFLKIIGIGLIGLVLLTVLIQRLFANKIEKISGEVRVLSGITATIEMESITKSEDIFMSGFQSSFLEKFYSNNSNLFEKMVNRNKLYLFSSIVMTIVQTFTIIVVLFVGGMLIKSNYISLELGITMYIYIQRLSSPINQLISQVLNMMEVLPSIDKVVALMKNNDDICWGEKNISGSIESIKYENISFKYLKQQSLLFDKFNCLFKRSDKKVIIVGENGTGKSTLLKLLFNMCEILQGSILINGIDIKDISEKSFRDNISFVSQIPLVIGGTIKENLHLKEEKDMEKALEILNIFGISPEWVFEKENVKISDKRNNFSGGELQKIAIARVILESKDVIIMDEPTSSLDEATVNNLLKFIDDYLDGKLVIIVTHDKRVIDWGNCIIEL